MRAFINFEAEGFPASVFVDNPEPDPDLTYAEQCIVLLGAWLRNHGDMDIKIHSISFI